jgi:hypothetical protein
MKPKYEKPTMTSLGMPAAWGQTGPQGNCLTGDQPGQIGGYCLEGMGPEQDGQCWTGIGDVGGNQCFDGTGINPPG